MCEDCGCMEGNERAYEAMGTPHEAHTHSHSHETVAARKEIHIHIHLDGASDVHVHTHTAESGGHSHHQHPHAHTHSHPHDHAGTHSHPHDHGNTAHAHPHVHQHEHSHVHMGATDHSHDDHHESRHDHDHDHGHAHTHGDGDLHSHSHHHDELPSAQRRTRTIALESNVLAGNDLQANRNREWLKNRGVVAVNLISSPGSGKTFLLEKTLDALKGEISCAVITGDMQTDNDARRMMGKGARVVQIETRSACHLDARQIEEQLASVVEGGVQLLFIENVGNLVCPAAFDLGEQHKIALVSVVEGEDKPVKYPVLFHGAAVTVITKTDLLPHLDVDIEKYRESVLRVQPGAQVLEVSAKTGDGMEAWLNYLRKLIS
jgi:hydrogenase nickel incorporation protein HypB